MEPPARPAVRPDLTVADDPLAVELALDATGVGVFEFDAATGLQRFSQPCREIWGLAPNEEPTNERLIALMHPDDRHLANEAISSLAPSGPGEFLIEHRIIRSDGALRWVRSCGRTLFEGRGRDRRAVRSVGTMLDITAERTARSRIEQLQTLTAALARAARTTEVIEAGVTLGGAALGASGGAMALLVEDGAFFELVAGPGVSPRIAAQWHRYPRDPQLPASQAVATGRPCYSHTRDEYVARDPRFVAAAEALGIEADATLPMVVGDRVLGVLSFIFPVPQAFGSAEDAYLRTVAEQCAQALERTRLFEAERDARRALSRAHLEARASAERVQLALAAGAIVGTWDWDLQADRFAVDERFAESFGIDPALGRTGLSLEQVISTVHPDDMKGLRAAIDAAIARGGPYSHEYRVRGRDGIYRWIEANGRVDRADDGTPKRFPGVLLDVERRRALEEERDRATELLRAFIDAVPGVVYAKDRQGRMLVANRGVTDLVGKPPEEYLGKTDLEFLDHQEQAEAVMSTDRRIMEGGHPETLEEEISFPDGRQAVWLSTKAPFHDADGRVIGLIGSSVDITDRKKAEAALIDADRRRNEFLAMLGHELRNPLAPIVLAVNLLERSLEERDRRGKAVQIIRRQTAQLSRLVDDLLEVSRVTQGRIELRKEDILVASAVYPAAETIRPLLREREQTLEIDLAPDLDVTVDPTRLTQILSNLLNNASKYTQPGGHIAVRGHLAGGDGSTVEIVVADNGPGIDPSLLPRVFDVFSQGATTLDRSRGGLGIGLALVKRLVELHGGTVTVESGGAGQGATFIVRLPRVERRRDSDEKGLEAAGWSISPTSFLVVDDNLDAVEAQAQLLEADGHRVTRASDGEAALDAARRVVPRVVLLDLGLPKIDGWEVARRLRADPVTSRAVLVAISGYGQADDRARSRRSGFDVHLLKPVDLKTVYQAIRSFMDQAEGE